MKKIFLYPKNNILYSDDNTYSKEKNNIIENTKHLLNNPETQTNIKFLSKNKLNINFLTHINEINIKENKTVYHVYEVDISNVNNSFLNTFLFMDMNHNGDLNYIMINIDINDILKIPTIITHQQNKENKFKKMISNFSKTSPLLNYEDIWCSKLVSDNKIILTKESDGLGLTIYTPNFDSIYLKNYISNNNKLNLS